MSVQAALPNGCAAVPVVFALVAVSLQKIRRDLTALDPVISVTVTHVRLIYYLDCADVCTVDSPGTVSVTALTRVAGASTRRCGDLAATEPSSHARRTRIDDA